MFGRRLINTQQGGGCTTDTLQILGDTSCVATYRLNGDATDLSGNYNGTATSVTYVAGQFGDAGSFNGSSSYIYATGLGITGNVSFSVSIWIKTISSGLFFFFGDGSLYASFYISVNANGTLTVGEFDYNLYTTTETVNDNNWHYVTFTSNGITSKLYIDGTETNSISNTFNISADRIELGRGSSSYYFNGSLDQVRIFNKAITAAEVTTLYNEVAC